MTKKQREMLVEIANGSDPNVWFQLVQITAGNRARIAFAKNMLRLRKEGYLGFARTGGLEITDKGRDYVDFKLARTHRQVRP